jgi:NADPH:quinone reductase-like Zn-dependent oxidoreductase
MKAVTFDAFGGFDVLKYGEAPEPQAGPGEVVLHVKACSVNRTLDIEVRERGAGFGVKLPHISGADPFAVEDLLADSE